MRFLIHNMLKNNEQKLCRMFLKNPIRRQYWGDVINRQSYLRILMRYWVDIWFRYPTLPQLIQYHPDVAPIYHCYLGSACNSWDSKPARFWISPRPWGEKTKRYFRLPRWPGLLRPCSNSSSFFISLAAN